MALGWHSSKTLMICAYAQIAFAVSMSASCPPTSKLPSPQAPPNLGTYVVAAVQYEHLPAVALPLPGGSPPAWTANVAQMEALITNAKSQTPSIEMFVFPEGSNGWFPFPPNLNRTTVDAFADVIPDVFNGIPSIVPCTVGSPTGKS